METTIKRIRSMVIGETVWVEHDFTDRLTQIGNGASVTSGTVEVTVRYGTDPDVDTMLQGSPATATNAVKQQITNGVVATLYLITFTAVCSDGTTLIEERLMEVTQFQESGDDGFETSDLP